MAMGKIHKVNNFKYFTLVIVLLFIQIFKFFQQQILPEVYCKAFMCGNI